MNDDQLRHCLRISLGSLAGYLFMHLTTWTTGLFFCVYPVLLLAMVPRMNGHAAFQFLAAAMINIVEVYLISGLFGDRPLLITPLVWALFAVRFHCMATGPYFLFGAQGLVAASVLFHFASYPDLDVTGMAKANLAAAVFTVAVAWLLGWLLPPRQVTPPPAPEPKSDAQRRHQVLLGATVATVSFLVFQIFSLSDSLSAQVTTLLMLFPMSFAGAAEYGGRRAVGVLLGCNLALAIQLLLYDWYGYWILSAPLYWVALMVCARQHLLEGRSGAGFAACTTIAVIFGQYLTPEGDAVYATLYRFSSIAVAVLVALTVIYLVHKLLNLSPLTRYRVGAVEDS